ncbi:MAG: hypothetical protein V4463_14780 [Pseudomonadota bacterium]
MPALFSFKLRPRGVPFMVMLALHGALLLAWLQAKHPVALHGPEPFFITRFLPAPKPTSKTAPPPKPVLPATPAFAIAPAPAPAHPIPEAPASTAQPSAAAAAADVLAQARRDVGAIDRALRGKAPPVPLVRPETKWTRFESALESAYIDTGHTTVMDRYVAADGVAIIRLTQGSKVACYMSGTVNASNGILGDSARPKQVNCPPANAGWTRI